MTGQDLLFLLEGLRIPGLLKQQLLIADDGTVKAVTSRVPPLWERPAARSRRKSITSGLKSALSETHPSYFSV